MILGRRCYTNNNNDNDNNDDNNDNVIIIIIIIKLLDRQHPIMCTSGSTQLTRLCTACATQICTTSDI